MQANLIKYEVRNIFGNFFIPLFGIAMPIFMGILIPKGIVGQVPEAFQDEVTLSIVLGMSIMIPMCVGLIGYAASYAQELEKKIPLRFKLFGVSNRKFIATKLIGQMIVVTITLVIYFITMHFVHGIRPANLMGTLIYFLFIYFFTICFLMISHAVADMIGKFGPTYAVIMILYFFLLFISGNMGLRYENFPKFLQRIADMIPLTHFSGDSANIWTNSLSNYGELIQSSLTLFIIACLLLLWSTFRKNKTYN
ncbi:ABC transporter permease [Facklamia sp. DSM 111018]|uniref:ABC transporter permease n=1 Tax=Facklamia lactis TaxID=2749967 RepID=A0ABS0LN51_9LACT|nr:ABC transporter permease [Facklamia lactis]MBG9985573.1 ABC transporter permease [Facklamia lactis]